MEPFVDHPEFLAARTFYERTIASLLPLDWCVPDGDLVRLLTVAQDNQESFRHLNLEDPPNAHLNQIALAQFKLIALLFDRHARPVFLLTHGPVATVSLLYSEMLRRLFTASTPRYDLSSRTARSFLHPLQIAFQAVAEELHNDAPVKPASLPKLSQLCAHYLLQLAFALHKLEHELRLTA